MAINAQLFEYLLRLGDSALILAQRLAEWSGHCPVLEEEMATANVGLDLIGHARLWLTYAAEVEGRNRDEDQLAFLRDAHDFRNVLLVEQPNGNYADTIARQLYFDAWHYLLLQELRNSKNDRIAEIAQKALTEVAYHRERSRGWVLRLGDGTDESHSRMQAAIEDLWMYTGELFESDAVDIALHEEGVGPDLAALRAPWLEFVGATITEATLELPEDAWAQRGGKQGRHTENLGHLLAQMQFLQRAYPGARW